MGIQTIRATWTGGLAFRGVGAFGTPIVTDGSFEAGGQAQGYKPSELLLFAIAGCTGIDVVRILKKQRQEVHAFEIEVTGMNNDEFPKPYHTIEIIYRFTGVDLDSEKVRQAIALSEEKYCMVSQTIKLPGTVKHTYEIIASKADPVS